MVRALADSGPGGGHGAWTRTCIMCGREQAALEGSRRGGALLQQLRERVGATRQVLLELRTPGPQGRSRARDGRADFANADVATIPSAATAAIPAP